MVCGLVPSAIVMSAPRSWIWIPVFGVIAGCGTVAVFGTMLIAFSVSICTNGTGAMACGSGKA